MLAVRGVGAGAQVRPRVHPHRADHGPRHGAGRHRGHRRHRAHRRPRARAAGHDAGGPGAGQQLRRGQHLLREPLPVPAAPPQHVHLRTLTRLNIVIMYFKCLLQNDSSIIPQT